MGNARGAAARPLPAGLPLHPGASPCHPVTEKCCRLEWGHFLLCTIAVSTPSRPGSRRERVPVLRASVEPGPPGLQAALSAGATRKESARAAAAPERLMHQQDGGPGSQAPRYVCVHMCGCTRVEGGRPPPGADGGHLCSPHTSGTPGAPCRPEEVPAWGGRSPQSDLAPGPLPGRCLLF